MITIVAMIVFFLLVALERFGVVTKYNDLFVGVAALVVAVTMFLSQILHV